MLLKQVVEEDGFRALLRLFKETRKTAEWFYSILSYTCHGIFGQTNLEPNWEDQVFGSKAILLVY